MDAPSFDRLARLLASYRSRRVLGGTLLAALTTLRDAKNAAAAPCPVGKQRCKERCILK